MQGLAVACEYLVKFLSSHLLSFPFHWYWTYHFATIGKVGWVDHHTQNGGDPFFFGSFSFMSFLKLDMRV